MSDDSSSDDDLLQSPIFKKKPATRRGVDRVEKNKLDFFDACLKGSDARTDVHRRIAEVDVEFGLRTEQQQGQDDEDGHQNIQGGEINNEKEENDKDDSDDDDDDDDEILLTDLGRLAEEAEAQKKMDAAQRKHNEDAYWAKIDSFTEKNTTKAPGSSRDTHSARRKLSGAVSGLEYYASDLSDEDGDDMNSNGGMTREQMRSEAEAKSQGSYSHLGLRKMFFRRRRATATVDDGTGRTNENDRGATKSMALAFASRQEAMLEFKSIASSVQKSYRVPKTRSEEVVRKFFVDPLVKITKSPTCSIWDHVYHFLIKNPILSGRYAIQLPTSFCEWMFKLACSSFHVGKHCSNACCQLIRMYILKKIDICTTSMEEVVDDAGTSPSFLADLSFLKNYCMDDLVSCLAIDFLLWIEHGPMPSVTRNDDEKSSCSSNNDDEGELLFPDVHALKNTALIWIALFNRDLIRIRDTNVDDGVSVIGADASRLLAALLRVGIDPSFNSDNTCGEPLLSLIQQVTASVIKTTTRQIISECTDGDSRVEQWREYTSGVMVDACSDLLAGEDSAADSDDIRGDLALAMAVKRMCPYDIETGFTIEIAQMKMMFAVLALRKCLMEITVWEDRVKERTDHLCKDWITDGVGPAKNIFLQAMHGLVTAEMGFEWMDEESESFMLNRPRVLAAVLIAGECALVGAGMFWRSRNDNEKKSESEEEPPPNVVEEQDAVHEVVSNIEDLCDGLKKECRAVIAYPHLRRTKEFLTRLSKQLGATKGKSSKEKRMKVRGQGSLDTYFSRPSLSQSQSQSDPYRGSQDS